jgi:hypothetical protein
MPILWEALVPRLDVRIVRLIRSGAPVLLLNRWPGQARGRERAACANWAVGPHALSGPVSDRAAHCCTVSLLGQLQYIGPCASSLRLSGADERAQTAQSRGSPDRRWPRRWACRVRMTMGRWRSSERCQRPGRWSDCHISIRVAIVLYAWTGDATHKKAGHLVSSIPIVAVLTGVRARAWRGVTVGCGVAHAGLQL